ncbi:hypothetical protein PTRA_a0880 [Pseudoalteromonas translucida KMM 520]|uniref:Uncharacterized protein n=1 Tax=Pseudoalteromonas translucida KMM 520 TaxID=1315283 RepID=A0A0U2MN51_9GAMM|nr:hypothetical protein PTRA_a0880 [Pseudoalteromonas translucida KMM 520]
MNIQGCLIAAFLFWATSLPPHTKYEKAYFPSFYCFLMRIYTPSK